MAQLTTLLLSLALPILRLTSAIPQDHTTTLPSSTLSSTTATPPCATPTGFANTIIRAPLPDSPKLAIPLDFIYAHLLFYYTDTNTLLPQASFAAFCLQQCVGYTPDPNAVPLPTDGGALPASYVGNSTGVCRGFTVDVGVPDASGGSGGSNGSGGDSAARWYCEGFDEYLSLEAYRPVDTPDSYNHALGVNRGCDQSYRAF